MHSIIHIRPRAPFDFARTARFLRYTETEAVDLFAANTYRRLFHDGERCFLLSVASQGTLARPLLAVTLEQNQSARLAQRDKRKAAQLVEQIFSVNHDLKKFRAAVAGDLLMSEIEAAHRGLHLARWPTLFEALTISILSQQISTLVAMVLKRRVVEKYGAQLEFAGELFYAFPLSESLAKARLEDLRALGISSAKANAVIALAVEVASGALREDELDRSDNETVIARLTQLRGIGRWTAEWALLLYFGRTNIFPAGDLALRNFVTKYYNQGAALSEHELRATASARWGEWSSYVTIYVLAALRTGLINLRPDHVLLSTKAQRAAGELAGKRATAKSSD
jgi:DNA-3-methyladenine glycosylase II